MKNFALAGLSLVLISCAGSNEKNQKKSSRVVDAKYTENVKGKTATGSMSLQGSCRVGGLDKKDWMDLVKIGSACAVKEKWKELPLVVRALNRVAPMSPWPAYFKSVQALHQKKTELALWTVELALKKAPKSGLLKYHQSRVLWSLGEVRLAVEAMEKAVLLDSELTDGYIFLGQIFLRDDLFRVAQPHFEKAVELDPKNTLALSSLAKIYTASKDGVKAEDVLVKLIRLSSKNIQAYLDLAMIYENFQKSPQKALRIYENAKKLLKDPTSSKYKFVYEKIKQLEVKEKKVVMTKNADRIPSQGR